MKIGKVSRILALSAATLVIAMVSAMPADAKVRKAKKKFEPWHGWVVNSPVAIYHNGIRYAGGSPKGPAAWYNNGEGGFNAKLFWRLHDRYAPG